MFQKLPPELIEKIAVYLPLDDLIVFRQCIQLD